MLRLLLFPVILSALLTVISIGAVSLGAAQSLPPALRDLDGCGLPCWSAISPRSTALRDAQTALVGQGYQEFLHDRRFRFIAYDPTYIQTDACRVNLNYSGSVVTLMNLSRCPGARLGDMIAVLGMPDGILDTGTALTFREGRVIVIARTMVCDRWFAPDLPVLSIYLLNAGTAQRRMMATFTTSDAAQAFTWRGFISEARYVRQEANFPVCPW